MILRQTLVNAVNGYWDGGKKRIFDWTIDSLGGGSDSRGEFVRIGCYTANHWFYVSKGKTDKLTLAYAKNHLTSVTTVQSTFEYIED